MLSPAELPGFRGLASEVLGALSEGSLVSVSVPRGPVARRWHTWLMEAIRRQTRERGEPVAIEIPALPGSLADPLADLAKLDSLGRIRTLDDLLEYHPDEGTLVLVIECEDTLSRQWKVLLDMIRRAYLGAGSQRRLRPVLAVIVSSHEYPPIAHNAGIRMFALWNPVRWEELRLLADAVLPRGENALTRAWRVATYVGAANGDPEILVRLCRTSPGPLDQVVTLAHDGADTRAEVGQWVRTTLDQRWEVPPAAVEPWAAGEVFGETIERGPVRAISGMAARTANRYLLAAIWREQLTGLLPVVVELGFNATAAITAAIGTDWHRVVPPERIVSDGDLRLEAREVMDIFSTGRFGRVPPSIWSLLDLLRRTRNDLAHMSPVELPRMKQIWQGHDLIRKRFGGA